LKVEDPDQRAYLVLVSEIMLQQTQVPRVIEKYKLFVQRFPSLEALSKASNADVLIAWKGMGYNSRALRLRDASQMIVGRFEGRFPTRMEELRSIKGIGVYTAGAIRNFAFGIPTPCIDTNIRRILHRFFVGPENPDGTWKKDDTYLMKIAAEVLEVATASGIGAADWHSALMDFGSLVMTKSLPEWELFSPKLRSICTAYGKQIMRTKKVNKIEPGIDIDGRFVPRRILRGSVIEVLRHSKGWVTIDRVLEKMALSELSNGEWFDALLSGLARDGLIERSGSKMRLKS
jgi:A/G-specific adenine glycosylase